MSTLCCSAIFIPQVLRSTLHQASYASHPTKTVSSEHRAFPLRAFIATNKYCLAPPQPTALPPNNHTENTND